SAPLTSQLAAIADADSVTVVDDTVFSGDTMSAVLAALPPRERTLHAFCLRAVAESLARVARLSPVTAGVAAPGRILEDVSFINASGLVRRGAIRRAGRRWPSSSARNGSPPGSPKTPTRSSRCAGSSTKRSRHHETIEQLD